MAASSSHGLARALRWLRKEFIVIWSVLLFFLVGFLLLISLVKMALANSRLR
jgi:hypothetical protein